MLRTFSEHSEASPLRIRRYNGEDLQHVRIAHHQIVVVTPRRRVRRTMQIIRTPRPIVGEDSLRDLGTNAWLGVSPAYAQACQSSSHHRLFLPRQRWLIIGSAFHHIPAAKAPTSLS